ncbi:MAG: CpaF family protein [Lachnospiraceae bacterium]|nr:CpaF family protein [Lachnospiraceae bacterium]
MELGVREKLRQRIVKDIDMTMALEDWEIAEIIDRCILEETKDEYFPLKEKVNLRKELFNSFRRLDVLTEYLEDDQVSEIMVNGTAPIFIEKRGRIIRTNKRIASEEKLHSLIQQIVATCNRRINEASPIVDARLEDGSRVSIVISPVSLSGTTITIRRFPKDRIGIEKLIELGTIDDSFGKVLKALVLGKYNIFISGGTGSGKTTFLNALSSFIPKDERIITIEDSAELNLEQVDNLVRLEARNANVEGENSVSIRDLIKASLRMRPDRIIVGEVRDQAAIDMLQAMNTGHDGSLSTGHANSPEDMISRLETMVLTGANIPIQAVRMQISQAVDIIIHLGRLRDRSRKVLKVSEVLGVEDGQVMLNTLYEFVETGEKDGKLIGSLRKVNQLINVDKLIRWNAKELYEEGEDGILRI